MQFKQGFIAARKVSTPGVVLRTPDATSSICTIREALAEGRTKEQAAKEYAVTPFASWDCIHGLHGINDRGGAEVLELINKKQLAPDATTQLPIALAVVEDAVKDMILVIHNAHLFWADPLVLQGVLNLRDKFKANGNMIILFVALGTTVPPELNNDMLLLTEPLPNREGIKQIVRDVYGYAQQLNPKLQLPSEKTLMQAGDALVGIAAFASDQAAAMSLDTKSGVLDIKSLWDRKRDIITATPGLSFYDGPETLADIGGLDNIKDYGCRLMEGKRGAQVLLRIDEIEKMFAGAGTDSSGVTGKLLGNFLSWVEDKHVLCMLFLGVPGASKSFYIYCLGGQYGKPVLNFNVASMQDSLVGNSEKNLSMAEATVEAISDGQIILCATANSLRGLPAELISRFEKGGIFFFDSPDADERAAILALKIKKFKLTPEQTAQVPDMTGWTGREIDSMCDKADMLGVTLAKAGQYVVPLTKSHSEDMATLRKSASNRFLSASKPGLYQYTMPETIHEPVVEVKGRKMRSE